MKKRSALLSRCGGVAAVLLIWGLIPGLSSAQPSVNETRPFVEGAVAGKLADALPLPEGFHRIEAAPGSFAAFLRRLPVRPAGAKVHLYDGTLKRRQDVQWRVLAIDVGRSDLQQCADAVMRLRAEWQRAAGRADQICFRFTSGDPARWKAWAKGIRPHLKGPKVVWKKSAAADAGEKSFRAYLRTVFMYAGTASLEQELSPIDARRLAVGDVLIHGGHPGHAMLVVDLIVGPVGEKRFALIQSYMPAQELHVVRGPDGDSPWFPLETEGALRTPEWAFTYGDFRRFRPGACARGGSQ